MKRTLSTLLATNPRKVLLLTMLVVLLLYVAVDPAAGFMPMERPPGQDVELD